LHALSRVVAVAEFRRSHAVPRPGHWTFAATHRMSAAMELLHRIVKPLFWAALLFAYVAAILPQAEAPKIASSDKVEHMIAFVTLALLGKLAYPRMATLTLGLALAGVGALIEFTQMIPALHRDGNIADWIADCAAIVVGLAAACLLLGRFRTR
jgi:VanZ family protein